MKPSKRLDAQTIAKYHQVACSLIQRLHFMMLHMVKSCQVNVHQYYCNKLVFSEANDQNSDFGDYGMRFGDPTPSGPTRGQGMATRMSSLSVA